MPSCDGRMLVQLHGQIMPIGDTHSSYISQQYKAVVLSGATGRYNADAITGITQYIDYSSIGSSESHQFYGYSGWIDNVHDRIVRSIHRSFNSDSMEEMEERDAN